MKMMWYASTSVQMDGERMKGGGGGGGCRQRYIQRVINIKTKRNNLKRKKETNIQTNNKTLFP